MQSDYIPEHTAAAGEFIQKGFPTELLFSIIEKTSQPNLVSMYFYISGKRSDEETLAAWKYLQHRFEMNPEKFETNSYDPFSLDGTYRYLLFAARKYLITKPKFKVFLTHLKCVQDDAACIIKSALSTLDICLDNIDSFPYHNDNERLIFLVRHYVQEVLPDFAVEPTRRNLSAEELEIVSHVSQFGIDLKCLAILGQPMIPILLYRRWLIHFFLKHPPAKPSKLKLRELFPPVSAKEDLIPFVGYDSATINFIYKEITSPEPPKSRRSKITTPEIRSAFQKMRDMVLHFSFDDYTGANILSPYRKAIDEILRVDDQLLLTWSIRNLLCERADVGLCIEMLNRIENVLLLQHTNDYEAYVSAIISTCLYFYFEQNIYDVGYSVDFCNYVFHRFKKAPDVNFYENLLLPYLEEDAFFDISSRRASKAYMALDTLLPAKGIRAYHLYVSSIQIKMPISWNHLLLITEYFICSNFMLHSQETT